MRSDSFIFSTAVIAPHLGEPISFELVFMGSENDSGGSRFYASYGRSYADSIISSHNVVGPTDIFISEGAEYIAIEHGILDQVTLYR